jgi:plastocyanin
MKGNPVSSRLLTGLAAVLCFGVGVGTTSAQAPAVPKKITAVPGPPLAWNPSSLELKEGEAVEFIVQPGQAPPHGVTILDWTAAKEFLEVEFVAQPPKFPAPAASTSANALLRLRVKKAPEQPVTFDFTCTVHGPGAMKGKLTLKK